MLYKLIAICDSLQSNIGDYSNVINDYNLCGLSKNSLQMKNDCFENHKEFNPGLHNASNVYKGEAPWMVQVEIMDEIKFWPDRYVLINKYYFNNSSII